MPVRRTTRRRRQSDDCLRVYTKYLISGNVFMEEFTSEFRLQYFTGEFPRDAILRSNWMQYGQALMLEHISEHPGTRPWGWWQFETTEDRILLGVPEDAGIELGDWPDPTCPYQTHFGIPRRYMVAGYVVCSMGSQEDLDTIFESLFETQIEYLSRFDLLTPEEQDTLETVAV